MRRAIYLFPLLPLILLLRVVSANAEPGRSQDRVLDLLSLSEAETGLASPAMQVTAVPTVTLRAASGNTIAFKTQNGEIINSVAPETMDLPYLVLFRNGGLTDPDERTLIIEISGITVPPTGVTITLELETQHGDPDLGGGSSHRIAVWRESRGITITLGITQTGVTAIFAHAFTETVVSDIEKIATPTDYFRYHIALWDKNHPIVDPWYAFDQDYVFLMESQWITRLPEVVETSAGAAPGELMVYYCDMFPFRKDKRDPSTWVPRKDVPDYVHRELIPAMIEGFRVQSDDWGFPWYDAWTSYRSGQDAERLSVALARGQTWFHGGAPVNGHSGLSLRVNGGGYAADYDSLTDALISVFHHELFHNLQRNIHQNVGDDKDVSGAGDAWRFFSEGTAVLAASVGGSAVEFGPSSGARHYMDNANRYLGDIGLAGGELNRSYERMSPYHAALYWRFLYEQCSGTRTQNDVADPAAGMDVIQRTLMALYSGEIVDIGSSTDLVAELPEIIDQALRGSSCPFETHQESLVAFARAIYTLRLESGRCTEPGIPVGCGFYDPNHLYHDPPVSTVTYTGTTVIHSAADQPYPAGIKSSFGMDFIDVILDPAADGGSLTIEFSGAPGADAKFNVQLWKLMESETGASPQRIASQITAVEIVSETDSNDQLVHVIPAIDTSVYNRLGLIITRVDADERSDPIGEYTIVLKPDTDGHSSIVEGAFTLARRADTNRQGDGRL